MHKAICLKITTSKTNGVSIDVNTIEEEGGAEVLHSPNNAFYPPTTGVYNPTMMENISVAYVRLLLQAVGDDVNSREIQYTSFLISIIHFKDILRKHN